MKESPAKLFRKAPTLLHLFNHQNEDAGERHHNDCRREHQSVRAGSYHNGGGDNRADHLTESSGNVQNAQAFSPTRKKDCAFGKIPPKVINKARRKTHLKRLSGGFVHF